MTHPRYTDEQRHQVWIDRGLTLEDKLKLTLGDFGSRLDRIESKLDETGASNE